jgi:cyclophilin family peptidyl-prolyl cis-trans isomerase
MSKNFYIIIAFAVILIFLFAGLFIYAFSAKQAPVNNNVPVVPAPSMTLSPTTGPPALNLKPDTQYQAVLKTSSGNITLDLFADKTPVTVNNFIYLSQKGFYDNTIFHRVINGFMIQGGDPEGNGSGGPGYTFADEPFTGEYSRGTVAMANAGPNTNGSQFFIMHQDNNLPKNYVIFGRVISGIEVVDKIAQSPVTTSNTGEISKPVNPAKIISVDILEKSIASPSATSAL